jgi:hypothetical protein
LAAEFERIRGFVLVETSKTEQHAGASRAWRQLGEEWLQVRAGAPRVAASHSVNGSVQAALDQIVA